MPDNPDRNRLRHAGRIPRETLDYLTAKRRRDSRLRWWEIPILLLVTVSLSLLVLLLVRSHTLSGALRIGVLIFLLSTPVLLRIRATLKPRSR